MVGKPIVPSLLPEATAFTESDFLIGNDQDAPSGQKSRKFGFSVLASFVAQVGDQRFAHPTGDGNRHVPATGTTNNGKVLKAGASAGSEAWGNVAWSEIQDKPIFFPPGAHPHQDARPGLPGFMSGADKTKLDGIAEGANNYTHPSGDGNQHVPATGTTSDGRFLRAGATAGSFSWQFLTAADLTSGVLHPDRIPALDASKVGSGVLDPARIPVLPSSVQVVSPGGLANLTSAQQNEIGRGTVVTTTDGKRHVYTGTGSKTAEASYIELADITPDWSVIANKPVIFPPAWHPHQKADVGLGNVDNTADVDKPVSILQQAALITKADMVTVRDQYGVTGECQLRYTSPGTLRLFPYNGNRIKIGGVQRRISLDGVSVLAQLPGGAALEPNTLYYVYAFWNEAQAQIRCELNYLDFTMEAPYSTDGTPVLWASPSSDRALVGMVFTNEQGEFEDLGSRNKWVRSWYNDPGTWNDVELLDWVYIASNTPVPLTEDIGILLWPNERLNVHFRGGFWFEDGDGSTLNVGYRMDKYSGPSVGTFDADRPYIRMPADFTIWTAPATLFARGTWIAPTASILGGGTPATFVDGTFTVATSPRH